MGNKITHFLSTNFFKGDKAVWMIYFFLCMISLVEIYSASSNLTYESGSHWTPMINQAGFLIVGFIVVLIVHRIPCKYFKLLPLVLLPVAIILLVCTLLFSGEVNTTKRFMQLGTFSFQPSELAKVAVVLTLAMILSKTQNEMKKQTKNGTRTIVRATKGGYSKAFKYCSIITLVVCGLIWKENLSTAGILFVVSVAMMFIGHVPYDLMFKGLGTLAVIGGIGITLLFVLPEEQVEHVVKRSTTWKGRIESWFAPKEDKSEPSIQEIQSQKYSSAIAISNSNIIGLGPGNSEGRDFLHHAESDFIYAIIIEEMGIFGGLFVMALYLALLVRVGRISQRCDKFFPAFLVMGLGMLITLQAMVNMGVAVGLLPVTGQTLPLISRGGTSILMVSFNIGMILSVSRYADKVHRAKNEPVELASPNETNEYYSSVGLA